MKKNINRAYQIKKNIGKRKGQNSIKESQVQFDIKTTLVQLPGPIKELMKKEIYRSLLKNLVLQMMRVSLP